MEDAKKLWMWLIVIVVVVLAGGLFWNVPTGNVVTEIQDRTITFSFSNLNALDQGHFEGWAIYGEEKVSTGKFNVGDSLTFTLNRNLMDADKIVVTIEPEGDSDSVPSGVVILNGNVYDGEAVELFPPFGFIGVTGTYILATPTNDPRAFENSGIWFLQLPLPLSAGLDLPLLPAGWKYEGWVVNQGVPITSGRFSVVDDEDEFNGYSGVNPGPPFPGEDYLVNSPSGISFPIDLGDGASLAVISVEPDINGIDPTGSAPFQIKPLVGEIPSGALDHINYPMDVNRGTMPSGIAQIS